ncbi:MAG: glycosyltransferase family 2 protein [Candidatus Magasanikbacteria bacterium]|nr:glycosyltransferase family 2 protein [Candidatus Magasanikbacteria bacterium]
MRFSLVIPTVNRPVELLRFLESVNNQTVKPDEIIVVIQGVSDAKRAVAVYPRLPISVVEMNEASLTKARNAGVAKSTGEIVGFVDDDCILEPDYVEKIMAFFTIHPAARGVQGIITNFEAGHTAKVGGRTGVYRCYNILAKIFLLNNSSFRNKLLLSGRNQYASRVVSVQPCEWLSGIGNYRREIFQEFHFDEMLQGYALGEDKLFSYPIAMKYRDNLFVDPNIRCAHEYGAAGRPAGYDQVRMKVRYTYYLWKKLLRPKGIHARLAYWWANFGDLVVVLLAVVARQKTFTYWRWHVKEYWAVWRGQAVL